MKTLVVLLALFAFTDAALGVPFARDGVFFAVKPGGQLVVIDGKLYCWRPAKTPTSPADVYTMRTPTLAAELKEFWVEMIEFERPEKSQKNWESEAYSLNLLPSGVEPRNSSLTLDTDEQGNVTGTNRLKEGYRWRAIKDPQGWDESRGDKDDVITVVEFRLAKGTGDRVFLGLAEKPRIVNGETLFPLILVDEKHAAQFAYNDFSGK